MARLVIDTFLISAALAAGDAVETKGKECVPTAEESCKGVDFSTLLQSRTQLQEKDSALHEEDLEEEGVATNEMVVKSDETEGSLPEDQCHTFTTKAACNSGVTGAGGAQMCIWGHLDHLGRTDQPRRRGTSYPVSCVPKTCQYFESEATCPDRCQWTPKFDGHREWWGLMQDCQPKTFYFGGDTHTHGSGYELGVNYRPEAFKSFRCTGASPPVCDDCGGNGCMKGDGQRFLKLNVHAPVNYAYYEGLFWTQCMGALFHVEIYDIANGEVTVYNEIGVKQEPKATHNHEHVYHKHKFTAGAIGGQYWEIPTNEASSTRLHVVFRVINPNIYIWLNANAMVYDPKPKVDLCMSHQMCLDELDGDGSAEGKAIRDSNVLQYKCLSTGTLPSPLTAKCVAWNTCLTNSNGKDHLLNILTAFVPPSLALSESSESHSDQAGKEVAAVEGTAGVPGLPDEITGKCLNPTSDDPESWDCDCAENIKANHCPTMTAPCIKGVMCNSGKICNSWKAAAGCPGHLLERANASQEVVQADQATSVDESLTTKKTC